MAANKLAQTFINFAEHECKGTSNMYEFLSRKVALDDALLALCEHVKQGQPIPNVLFGAVHYLLLLGQDHTLAKYYPGITDNPLDYRESFQLFKDFCLNNESDIISIFNTRFVQTNEIRRCAYLYPVFCTVFEKIGKPLALIEIGTSAGLQLLWDKYSYSYDGSTVYSNAESNLHIESEIKGANTPVLYSTPPPVTSRFGLDLNPIDLNHADEKLWLKSLIWPEHKERLNMFEEAAKIVQSHPVELVRGDGVGLLRDYVAKTSRKDVVCIFHTHVANQMPMKTRLELMDIVKDIGRERDICHIYNNIEDKYLHMDCYVDGEETKMTIAETDPHGRWFEWL